MSLIRRLGFLTGPGNRDICTSSAGKATANGTADADFIDVIGLKADTAATGAVSTTKSTIAYLKQLTNGIGGGLTSSHPRFLSGTALFTSAAWNTAAFQRIAAVTGVVRLYMLMVGGVDGDGAVITGGGGATLSLGTVANTAAFIAATPATSVDNNEIWAGSAEGLIAAQILDVVPAIIGAVVSGTNVGITIGVAALTAGSLDFYLWWDPISSDAAVVIGAGETT